jgi:hypothetical protein
MRFQPGDRVQAIGTVTLVGRFFDGKEGCRVVWDGDDNLIGPRSISDQALTPVSDAVYVPQHGDRVLDGTGEDWLIDKTDGGGLVAVRQFFEDKVALAPSELPPPLEVTRTHTTVWRFAQ